MITSCGCNANALEYLKSFISVNPVMGCTIDCSYCFLSGYGIVPSTPKQVYAVEDIVDEMIASPLFMPGQTVISINNRTEPFLNTLTTQTTIDTVKAIAKRGLRNPVCITTKMAVDDYSLRTLADTAIGKLFLCITYSGLPKTLEPLGHRSQEQAMRSISKVKRDGMYLFHLFRPIMQGYNDRLPVMQDVMSFAMQYADCTVYTGVKIDNEIMARLRVKGNIVDDQQMQAYKHLPRGFQVALQSIARSGKSYPIFRHTSCAISWALQTPDYNAYWDQGKCTDNCPNYHSCLPYVRVPTPSQVQNVLKRIGVEAEETITRCAIYVNANMTLEQAAAARHMLKYPVRGINGLDVCSNVGGRIYK